MHKCWGLSLFIYILQKNSFSHFSILLCQFWIYKIISFLYLLILKLSFMCNHIVFWKSKQSHLHWFLPGHMFNYFWKNPYSLSIIFLFLQKTFVLFLFFFFFTYNVSFIGPYINITSTCFFPVRSWYSLVHISQPYIYDLFFGFDSHEPPNSSKMWEKWSNRFNLSGKSSIFSSLYFSSFFIDIISF